MDHGLWGNVMVWQAIDPRFVKQTDAHTRTLWYRDDGRLDTGELLLWVDPAGGVTGFQLSHTRWPRGREHLVEWHRGGELRVGEVDTGEVPAGVGYKMSPTIRYLRQPDPQVLAELVAYFEQRASVLESRHREAIAAVLCEGLRW